ncbi:MAG: hypothetical protein MUP31_07090, partial [Xanthomonadales bacterium]|nr:hypothetical protein [Xanthomonadales bacterium]
SIPAAFQRHRFSKPVVVSRVPFIYAVTAFMNNNTTYSAVVSLSWLYIRFWAKWQVIVRSHVRWIRVARRYFWWFTLLPEPTGPGPVKGVVLSGQESL